MATAKKNIDVRDLIQEQLDDPTKNLSLMWLSKAAKIPYGTLYASIAERKFSLNDDNLLKINEVLGTDFKNND